MEEYLSILKKSNLFSGVQPEEISAMLNCLSARIRHFKKEEFIIRSGDYIRSVGMLLSGSALIIQEDFWGKRTIISDVMPGTIFAETYAYHAMVLGYEDEGVNHFFYKALSIISYDLTMEQLLPVVLEVGEVNLKCMELLDKANTTAY